MMPKASSESSLGELLPFVWSLYRFNNSPHILQQGDKGAIAGAEAVAKPLKSCGL